MKVVVQCPGTSQTGAYRIAWEGPEGSDGAVYRVESGEGVVYEGGDLATTVTGRLAGSVEYRVGVVGTSGAVSGWSDPCVVDVRPPSMELALSLLATGFVVFAATAAVVVVGHRKHRRGEIG